MEENIPDNATDAVPSPESQMPEAPIVLELASTHKGTARRVVPPRIAGDDSSSEAVGRVRDQVLCSLSSWIFFIFTFLIDLFL